MNRRRRAAFTLIELLIASAVSVLLSGIIYTLGSEALITFSRNISINRSYTDARLSLERIANAAQSAGHVPTLVDSSGLNSNNTQAAGCRFYRSETAHTYAIPSGNSGSSTLAITVATGQYVPAVGDLVAISQIGFQGTITSLTCTVLLLPDAKNAGPVPVTATLGFAGTITSGCVPPLSAAKDFTIKSGSPSANPPVAGTAYSCQIYTQVAFIAVPPVNGAATGSTQLRYYRRAMSASATGTACGGLAAFNNATAFNNAANYKVIASLPLNGSATQLLPFAVTSPVLNITLCAEGPDYNNRSLHTANTFSQMNTSLGARCPILLRGPY